MKVEFEKELQAMKLDVDHLTFKKQNIIFLIDNFFDQKIIITGFEKVKNKHSNKGTYTQNL